MSVAKVTFQGDASSVVKAAAAASSSTDKLEKDLVELQKQAKKTEEAFTKGADANAKHIEKLIEKNTALSKKLDSVETEFKQVSAAAKQQSADYAKMVAETGRLIDKNTQLERSFEKVQSEMAQVKTKGSVAFTGLLAGAKTLVAGLGLGAGIAGALRLVTAEFRAMEELTQARKNVALTVEGAEANIATNISSTGDAAYDASETSRAVSAGRAIASKTNVPILDVQNAIAAGLSASGGDIDATLAAVEQQAELNRSRPEDIVAGTSGVLSVMGIMQTTDAEAAQGILESIGAKSEISSPAKIAETAPRALAAGAGYGYDIQEVGAFFSQLTRESKDNTGDRSSTAVISFVEQLFEFFNKGKGKKFNKAAEADRGYGLGFLEQIQTLQNNPKLGAEFQENLTLEKAASGPVRNMILDQMSTMATGILEIIATAPTDMEGLAGAVTSRRARLGAVGSVAIGDTQRSLDAAQQEALLGDAGTSSVFTKQELYETLQSVGYGATQQTNAGLVYGVRRMAGQSEQEAYSGTISSIAESAIERGDPRGDRLNDGLQELIKLQREQNEILKKSTTAPRTPDRQAAGGA